MAPKERTQGKRNRQYILNYGNNFNKDGQTLTHYESTYKRLSFYYLLRNRNQQKQLHTKTVAVYTGFYATCVVGKTKE